MKIGFFLDNRTLSRVDFRQPELGNPGTGAAAYLHVALPYFFDLYGEDDVEVCIFAHHVDLLPSGIAAYEVRDVVDAAHRAKSVGVDFFVFRPRVREEDGILDVLDELDLPSVGRAALTPHPRHLRKMAASGAFKALVCVGREQYDSLIDTPLLPKLVQIDNGVHLSSCLPTRAPNKDPRLVAYMGALVPQKGFHLLARAWPKVLDKFPDAKLSVIGSPRIYNEQCKLGPLGIADKAFEDTAIVPYLTRPDGTLHPSVTFHGQLGPEKYEILCRAAVGVANPSGHTETCCVSAVEMAACKTAVISGAYFALLDAVQHDKTGLLGRTVADLESNICALLTDSQRAYSLGEAGYFFVKEKYDFSVVAPKWLSLFRTLKANEKPSALGGYENILRHYKWLRILNRPFQAGLGKLVNWPTVAEAEMLARKIWKSVKQS